jgi:hypothetical protein
MCIIGVGRVLVLVASINKNSPAFCCGAEAFIAAKGGGQQKEYDILSAPARRQHVSARSRALALELRPPGRLNS